MLLNMYDEGQKSLSVMPLLCGAVEVFPQSTSHAKLAEESFWVSAGLCYPPKTCVKAAWLDVPCQTGSSPELSFEVVHRAAGVSEALWGCQ